MCDCADYWGSEDRIDRMKRCRQMLYEQGVITEAENARIIKRIADVQARKKPKVAT